MQKPTDAIRHIYSMTAIQAPHKAVEVPVYQMPKAADGRQRFPTRSDGAEAAVMRGAVATAKITLG